IHRLFIKPSLKRQGLGTKLLLKAEEELKLKGITIAKVHLGEPEEQWFESYNFYPKHGYVFCGDRLMMKDI
ncbi:N-acetyltransferase, partial [Butyrivibrio sp.]